MAAEYSALLKWPQSKEEDLKFCLGKHSILILELELRKPHPESGSDIQTHTIDLPEGWTKIDCADACFVHISPVKNRMMKGTIVALSPVVEKSETEEQDLGYMHYMYGNDD